MDNRDYSIINDVRHQDLHIKGSDWENKEIIICYPLLNGFSVFDTMLFCVASFHLILTTDNVIYLKTLILYHSHTHTKVIVVLILPFLCYTQFFTFQCLWLQIYSYIPCLAGKGEDNLFLFNTQFFNHVFPALTSVLYCNQLLVYCNWYGRTGWRLHFLGFFF